MIKLAYEAEIIYLYLFFSIIVANKKYLAHIWLECFDLKEALNLPC